MPFAAFLGCGAEGLDGDLAAEHAALGTVYEVGPGKPFTSLAAVASRLAPGDIVNVQGNATHGSVVFTRRGAAANKIAIRGITVNGERPLVSGGTNTIEFRANHYVMENMEVTGGSSRCVYHHAHDITVRTTAVHDCPAHGILGADSDSGSLTLDQVEAAADVHDHHRGRSDREHAGGREPGAKRHRREPGDALVGVR